MQDTYVTAYQKKKRQELLDAINAQKGVAPGEGEVDVSMLEQEVTKDQAEIAEKQAPKAENEGGYVDIYQEERVENKIAEALPTAIPAEEVQAEPTTLTNETSIVGESLQSSEIVRPPVAKSKTVPVSNVSQTASPPVEKLAEETTPVAPVPLVKKQAVSTSEVQNKAPVDTKQEQLVQGPPLKPIDQVIESVGEKIDEAMQTNLRQAEVQPTSEPSVKTDQKTKEPKIDSRPVQESTVDDDQKSKETTVDPALADANQKEQEIASKPDTLKKHKGKEDSKEVNVNIRLHLSKEGIKDASNTVFQIIKGVKGIFEYLINTFFKPVDEFEEYSHFMGNEKYDQKYSVKLTRQLLSVTVIFVVALILFGVTNNLLGTIIKITFIREVVFGFTATLFGLLLYKYHRLLSLKKPLPIVVMSGGILMGVVTVILLISSFYITFLLFACASAFFIYYGITRLDVDLEKLSKQYGNKKPPAICPTCGSKLKNGSNYCHECEEFVY